jgi:3-oxoacyl-[acyl-carrier protein] reductase
MKLSEAKAIITGAGSGMGRTFAVELARAGAKVVAADINEESLRETVAAANELSGSIHPILANVADEQSVIDMIQGAAEAMGGVNVLVNNAGIFRDGLLVKVDRETGKVARTMSLKQWQQVIDVDLTGPFLCTREFASHCIDSGIKDAVVVNISSVSRHGNPGQTNYSAAKAGLIADTKLWAQELSRYGIRTGAIAPGFVRTPILDGMRPEVLQGMVKAVPLRRVAEPEEIFSGVRFIIECGYFTGRCIDIDGGMSV